MPGGTALGGFVPLPQDADHSEDDQPHDERDCGGGDQRQNAATALPPGIHSHGLLLAESVDCTAELPYRACREGPSYGAVVLLFHGTGSRHRSG